MAHDYKREYEAAYVLVTLPPEILESVPESERKQFRLALRDAWSGPLEIVLDTGDRVWVAASYGQEMHPEMKRIGQEDGKGYDCHGNCVLSIPSAWCKFISTKEAEQVMQMIDADEKLLSYI